MFVSHPPRPPLLTAPSSPSTSAFRLWIRKTGQARVGLDADTVTNQTQEAQVYSHHGPIGCRKRGYILTTDQSDAGSA
eukprot:211122-Prorocentrum_minimum.AAC.1